jgi:3-hydroxyacyl-CoA dehydrogenase / enoyl-CoA hydratase / 3-hydroxybutyryl-CoA epimerase
MHIYKAGVLGAGTMGAEIALVIGASGLPVVLKDVDRAILERGMDHMRSILRKRVAKGAMDESEMTKTLSLVTPSVAYDGFGDADIVVEAVPEQIAIKKAVLRELEAVVPETTIFASNTSALSISELAAATGRPARVIGMHFFNPAHVMRLVEVVPGLETSAETLEDVVGFARSLGKTPVSVRECPGFLVNRLLFPYLNEAARCLQEGAARADEIDAAAVGFGMPMGPLALMDMLGLDVCLHISESLYEQYGPRMEPPWIYRELVAAGRLGRKTGTGFRVSGESAVEPVEAMIAAHRPVAGVQGQSEQREFGAERLIYPLINEAVWSLQECIAPAHDVDLAMVAGSGMTFRGGRKGPLTIADELGLDVLLEGLEGLCARQGERFRPAWLLRTKVSAGHLGLKAGRGFHEYA